MRRSPEGYGTKDTAYRALQRYLLDRKLEGSPSHTAAWDLVAETVSPLPDPVAVPGAVWLLRRAGAAKRMTVEVPDGTGVPRPVTVRLGAPAAVRGGKGPSSGTWVAVLGVLFLVLGALMIYFSTAGDKDVLVWQGHVVAPNDRCLGAENRRCGDVAHSERRYQPASVNGLVGGSVFTVMGAGCLWLARRQG
ncbi:hypothetical protein [Streptomyces orinoci]|uniref:Uncharacterized protein n=1 Tax=Streptomyces orinoci TaxID=67339 RepID=A0ABV3JYK4_STRON|nr:hypothetical protein [Streptomyces orinoci]